MKKNIIVILLFIIIIIAGVVIIAARRLNNAPIVEIPPLAETPEESQVRDSSAQPDGIVVKAFFGNRIKDPTALYCDRVYPVERLVPKTQAVARAALQELLAGPTALEEREGYVTPINAGVKIQKLVIENGTAFVDFDETLEAQVGGSCRVTIIRAQIKETLKQFPSVKNVVLTINGRGEDIILQP